MYQHSVLKPPCTFAKKRVADPSRHPQTDPHRIVHDLLELPPVRVHMGGNARFLPQERADEKFLSPGKAQEKEQEKDADEEKSGKGGEELLPSPGQCKGPYGHADPCGSRGRIQEPRQEEEVLGTPPPPVLPSFEGNR